MPIASAPHTTGGLRTHTSKSSIEHAHATDETSCLLDFISDGPLASRHAAVARNKPGERSLARFGKIARCQRGGRLAGAELTSRADAFTVCIDLQGSAAHAAVCDECSFIAPARQPGEVTIYDRRYRWRFDLPDSFDGVLLHLPRQVFERLTNNASFDWSATVPGLFSGGRADETLRYLGMATWLSFKNDDVLNAVFADHLTASVMQQVTERYGVAGPAAEARGGLGPWREARIRDLVGVHLHEALPLASLAKACGLSTSHFAREFKTSFGCSPHHWLRRQRLERAKTLMRTTSETLSDIAVAAGFADQSHMTRIFSQHENISPAAWRRNSAQRTVALKPSSPNRSAYSVAGRAKLQHLAGHRPDQHPSL
jgi:AraC family transcriptional regulator